MEINTRTIRRLRDNLLQSAVQFAGSDAQPAPPAIRAAIARRLAPFAEIMYLTMVADGEVAPAEQASLTAALQILADGQFDPQELDALFENFAFTAREVGVEERIMAIGAILGADRDDRETAFTLAAAVAVADEAVDVRENALINLVREYFGITLARAAALLDDVA
ncbi:MAG: TerB family tellurite resistance protein [Proteobacteria bacterium]|nr:TerB family tellurite resistance protein [Pseudomonadota bacterium]